MLQICRGALTNLTRHYLTVDNQRAITRDYGENTLVQQVHGFITYSGDLHTINV